MVRIHEDPMYPKYQEAIRHLKEVIPGIKDSYEQRIVGTVLDLVEFGVRARRGTYIKTLIDDLVNLMHEEPTDPYQIDLPDLRKRTKTMVTIKTGDKL